MFEFSVVFAVVAVVFAVVTVVFAVVAVVFAAGAVVAVHLPFLQNFKTKFNYDIFPNLSREKFWAPDSAVIKYVETIL